jgi:MFS family permease
MARLKNIYIFDALSTLSWQMCLTSPLILFLRAMDASALALGIVNGVNLLMSFLQLPASRWVAKQGHRRQMVFGWTVRTIVLTPLAVLPLLVVQGNTQLIVWIVVAMITLFTALRHVAVVAWMPWLSALVPSTERGAFLARDRTFMNLTALAGTLLAAFLLRTHAISAYAAVFGIGIAVAYASLYFLNRIPDAPRVETAAAQPPTSLTAVFRNPEARRLMIFAALAQVINQGTVAVTMVFARTRVGLSDSALLLYAAAASLVVMGAMTWARRRLDITGSKPFLRVSLAWWTCAALGWLGLSLFNPQFGWLLAPVLIIVTDGMAWLFEMVNMRLVMNTLAGGGAANPAHFASYTVTVNTIAGLAPVGFGALLDALRGLDVTFGAAHIVNYSLVFALELPILIGAMLALRRVRNG